MLEQEQRTASVRARRHDATRTDILTAAWRLAEGAGIAGLSFREVARAVGLRAPSLYTYFASKDALYDAMFAEGYRQLGDAVDDWNTQVLGDEPADALGTVIARWVRFCQESIARYQIMFTQAVPGWEPSADAYAVSARQYERMVDSLTALGVAEPDDVDLFTAVASGLAAQQIANDPEGDRWVRLAPTAARMLLDDITRRQA